MNEIFGFSKNSVCGLKSGIRLEKHRIHNTKPISVRFGSESTVFLGA